VGSPVDPRHVGEIHRNLGWQVDVLASVVVSRQPASLEFSLDQSIEGAVEQLREILIAGDGPSSLKSFR
jgi:hypothetical protein